jgi:hypothetical protein
VGAAGALALDDDLTIVDIRSGDASHLLRAIAE